jgi:hypothetical protein
MKEHRETTDLKLITTGRRSETVTEIENPIQLHDGCPSLHGNYAEK